MLEPRGAGPGAAGGSGHPEELLLELTSYWP